MSGERTTLESVLYFTRLDQAQGDNNEKITINFCIKSGGLDRRVERVWQHARATKAAAGFTDTGRNGKPRGEPGGFADGLTNGIAGQIA